MFKWSLAVGITVPIYCNLNYERSLMFLFDVITADGSGWARAIVANDIPDSYPFLNNDVFLVWYLQFETQSLMIGAA